VLFRIKGTLVVTISILTISIPTEHNNNINVEFANHLMILESNISEVKG